jgi:hypothetical protein
VAPETRTSLGLASALTRAAACNAIPWRLPADRPALHEPRLAGHDSKNAFDAPTFRDRGPVPRASRTGWKKKT